MDKKSNIKFWDKIAKIYNNFMKKDKKVYNKVCEYISPYLDKSMTILELACGTGQITFNLLNYVKKWTATDFSVKMINEAKKHGNYENLLFEVADAASLPFTDKKFDCVVISNALHIMPNPEKAMQEINRVLKPNGLLFAPTFLWKEGMKRKITKIMMSILGFKMYHEWDKKQFEKFINQYGFNTIKMKMVYGGIVPIGTIISKKIPLNFNDLQLLTIYYFKKI